MRASSHTAVADPRPWEWLYDVVGAGMWASSRLRFDVQVAGWVPRVGPGQLWAVTHRAESDVPVLGGLLYVRGRMWRQRGPGSRVHFAARDDLFAAGVVSAGLPLPTPLARLAWPLSPGPFLPRVRAHPVRRPTGLKLGQALAGLDESVPLEAVVGKRVRSALESAAAELGRPSPATVGQACDATFRQVLWGDVTAADFVAPDGETIWRRHVSRSAGDLRRLVGLLRGGESLVVFPEGRLSPDGTVGPVGEVLRVLAERGRPDVIIPVSLTYDPLRRRPTVVAAPGAPITPTSPTVADDLLRAWRSSIALTLGQVVADILLEHARRGERRVARRLLLERIAASYVAAKTAGRPTARAVRSAGRRARGLDTALQALHRRGCVTPTEQLLALDVAAVRSDPVIARLATEYRSFADAT